jgi:hypothetical protein
VVGVFGFLFVRFLRPWIRRRSDKKDDDLSTPVLREQLV